MKPSSTLLINAIAILTFPALLHAQEGDPAKKTEPTAQEAAKEAATPKELEDKFIKTLTNAKMSGRWCLIRDGELTPAKDETYTIVGVSKQADGSWIVQSRIQYNQIDIVVPVPVKVEWAGDTPVIIVDDLAVPGGGVYSARVLIYDNTYAGTWSGGARVKGLLNGKITQEEEKKNSNP